MLLAQLAIGKRKSSPNANSGGYVLQSPDLRPQAVALAGLK